MKRKKNRENSGSKTHQEIRQMFRIGIVIAAVVVVVVSGFLQFYNTYMDQMLYAERLKQMQEVTGQLFAGLEDVVSGQWNAAEIYCNYIERGKPATLEELQVFMGKQEELNMLDEKQSDLVAVDSRGIYYTQNGRQGTVNEMQYFLDEPERVSFISKAMTTDETKMYFLIRLPEPVSLQDGEKTVTILYYGGACNMEELNPYFTCEAYDGNNTVYVLDQHGERLFAGENEKLLSGYNLFSVLGNMEYLHGSSLEEARRELDLNGVAYSNAMLDGREYYYSIYQMKYAQWIVLFLVPSDYVAVNTVQMINTTLHMILIFAIGLLLFCVGLIYVMLRKKQKQEIAAEREMNQNLELLNQKLEKAVKTAEDASMAKTDFLSNMSHDIRTPMNAIVGLTELMQHHMDDPRVMSRYISKLQSSSHYLLDLINDILELSKIENGSLELKIEPMNIREQTEQVLTIIRPQLTKKELQLSIEEDCAEYGRVMGDPVRFRQVLMNLFSNAYKYTPKGGSIRFTVQETAGDERKQKYLLAVEDSGIGMSPEFVEHIFDPFVRAEATVSEIQGTGLGMAITKSIITAMGGTIRVESTLGKGSRFEVALSFELCPETDGAKRAETPGALQMEKDLPSLRGMRFLCAEDNELNAEILSSMLELEGAQCTIYGNGKQLTEAFEKVVPGEYDAILMDVQMPVMNGYDATRQIRNSINPLEKSIPIIAMTANAFQEDIQRSADAGMDAHVSKPVDMKTLLTVINQEIGGSKVR